METWEIFEDITNNVADRELYDLARTGSSNDSMALAVTKRIIELKHYPAFDRMTKLIKLRHFVMSKMDYDTASSARARRMIASELLEIKCLPVVLRVEYLNFLAEACEPEDSLLAREIRRDCVSLAEKHNCMYAAMSAVHHLEAARS